jgi:hypothetical protein
MITPIERQHADASSSSWLQWAFATAIGSTLGAMTGGALITAWMQPYPAVTSPIEAATIGIPRIAGALGVWAAGIGIMQALLLWRQMAGAHWWPLATIAGWAIAGALGGALPVGGAVTGRGVDIGPLGFVAVGMVVVSAMGLLSSLLQWLILRQQAARAAWWIWTTAGGIALGMLAAAALLALMSALRWLRPEDFPSATSWGIAGAAVGLIYGTMSGRALRRLLYAAAAATVDEG